jgi:hypothetical protein
MRYFLISSSITCIQLLADNKYCEYDNSYDFYNFRFSQI